ncbi:MAG: TetR/AcrR family transcriptional regulator [Erythrobacter sp.]
MPSKTEALTREDWIKGGFRALTTGGPEAVKIEKIAREMKVSKGSFYWHFKDQAALKSAMMSHWEAWGTQAIIDRNEERELSPKEKLQDLSARITNSRDAASGGLHYGGLMMEAAIRDWSRFDKNVRSSVRKVNSTRLDYIAKLFAQLGLNADQSKLKANLLYSSMIGLEFLEHQKLADLESDLSELLTLFLCNGDDTGG